MDYNSLLTNTGMVIVGVMAVVYYMSKTRRQQILDDESTAKNLIENLKSTVEIQTRTIEDMKKELRQVSDDYKRIQGENALLKELFKGRDPAMQNFLKEVPEVIKVTKETSRVVKDNNVVGRATNDAITNLTKTIDDFIKQIMVHTDTTTFKK